MRHWEEALAKTLPPFIRRMIVVPCPCCGEPARWQLPRLPWLPIRLRLLLSPLRLVLRREALLLLAVVGTIAAYGTPHVAWDYVCYYRTNYGSGCPAYEYCAYYGVHGRRLVFPERGEACWLIRLLPAPSAR